MRKDVLHTCCFFGHRKIDITDDLINALNEIVERLIIEENVDTFLFGSKSQFNNLCLKIVTGIKIKYPHIRRIYVRAEFPYIDEDYREYLSEKYEYTYYPDKMINAGKAAYIERNYEMIDNSSFCVVYYEKSYIPPIRKNRQNRLSDYQPQSGTKLAYDYAKRKGKKVINVLYI